MTLALFEDRGTPINQQRFTWRELAGKPISKLDDDAFTRRMREDELAHLMTSGHAMASLVELYAGLPFED